ncbi:MAG: hypothetical protein Q8P77_04105 [Candidatus Veblenbacteria bacterium]|nr:hypothetical protein [Candidatus Veblenbacteria bacterium]
MEEKATKVLVEHGERLANIERKLDATLRRDEYLAGYDQMMSILRRLDQERIFTVEWVRRIEEEVERHTKELAEVKQQLKIA